MSDTVRMHAQRRDWTLENVHQLFARTTRKLCPPPLQQYATWMIWVLVGLGITFLGWLIVHPGEIATSSPMLMLRRIVQ